MPAIGFQEDGFGFDRQNPDYRCFFKFQIGPPPTGVPTFREDFLTTYKWFRRTAVLSFTYDIDVDGPFFTGNLSGSGQAATGFPAPGSELSVGCCTRVASSFSDSTGNLISCGVQVLDYDSDSQEFIWYPQFILKGGINSDPNSLGDPVEVDVAVTILDQTIQLYAENGVTASGTFDITVQSYWPYQHSFYGPIWDSVTGDQLIDPIPEGV